MTQPKCNLCGVPEATLKNLTVCTICRHYKCETDKQQLIEQRVYNYAKKHDLLTNWRPCKIFIERDIRNKLQRNPTLAQKLPQYISQAISCP